MFNVKDDIRIEIMEALLNNSAISGKAFTALAGIFDAIDGENDAAWEAYKAKFGLVVTGDNATPT